MIKLTDVLNEIKINSPSSIIPLKVYREHVFNYFKDKVPNPGLFKNELEEAKDVMKRLKERE
jgi:hypothetical protein